QFDVDQQYKNEFIRELLLNDSMRYTDLIEKGQKYQYKNDCTYTCVLFTTKNMLDGNEKVMKVNKATHFIQKEFPLSIVGAIRDYICVLFPSKSFADQGAKAICEKVRYDLDAYVERGFVAGIGAGKAYEGINGLRK